MYCSNVLRLAYVKAIRKKISELELQRSRLNISLDEIFEDYEIQLEISKLNAELDRVLFSFDVAFKVVAFVLLLILVYMSPDNSKIPELLC